MADPQFYSPEDFAVLINKPAQAVRRFCRQGVIPSVKLGQHYRIPASALSQMQGQGETPNLQSIDRKLVRQIRQKLDAHLIEVAKLNQLLAELEDG